MISAVGVRQPPDDNDRVVNITRPLTSALTASGCCRYYGVAGEHGNGTGEDTGFAAVFNSHDFTSTPSGLTVPFSVAVGLQERWAVRWWRPVEAQAR